MIQDYQKTVNGLRELRLAHPGILNAGSFARDFELHCYEPSADLRPFVVHIWTQRWRGHRTPQARPIEILSGPNMYLFFTADSAFVHGITPREFVYDPLKSPVVAGVKFRPGGLHAFCGQSVQEASVKSLFPEADEVFRTQLLSQPDHGIVNMLSELLLSKHPTTDPKLELITCILDALDTDHSLQTVEKVAQRFAMSERSLQLLFQTYVGVGLKWILTRRRLLETVERARGHSDFSWAAAAAESGYSSQSHFYRDFKNCTGLSPSDYRASITNPICG